MAGDEDRLFWLEPVKRAAKKTALRRTKDGVIDVREFGGWTLEKLKVLELYFKLYTRVAGNGTYIDGFAGRGSIVMPGSDREDKGSVRLAIESKAFKDLWVFEKDEQTMDGLMKNLSYWYPARGLRRIHAVRGDFNVEVARVLSEGRIPRDKPCFAFLDPNSTELLWETVELLARFKEPVNPPKVCKAELWILFNSYQALVRLLDRQGKPGYETSPRAAALDRVMGERDVWWPLHERGAGIDAYAQAYAERLGRDLGYAFAHPQLIKNPSTGQPQYHMIHASDHPAAFQFMRWAKMASRHFDNTESFPDFDA